MQTVKFSPNKASDFHKTLRKRVNEYFKSKNISRHANAKMVLKTIFMLTLYIAPFVLITTVVTNAWVAIGMWALMGLGTAGVGLSVMHDANHGAYSKNATINKLIGYSLLALGGSDLNWRIQHNVLHHTYTNIEGMDEDIDAPSAILRFSPHSPLNKIHKYQYLYAWFFYGLMTLMWFLTKDYQQAIRYHKKGLLKSQNTTLAKHLSTIIISKVIYGAIILGIPIFFGATAWYITIIGYVLMQFIGGLLLGIIFQPAHVLPSTDYPLPDPTGNIESDWAIHQLYTTANFAPRAKLFSWYVGGLNYQVEHHLFPNICHVHYPAISQIVRDTATEYGLPYHTMDTFREAVYEHGKMLYQLGRA
jgi:linoleoyl-CoA desaturase